MNKQFLRRHRPSAIATSAHSAHMVPALIAAPPASAPNHITYGRSKMASFETIFRIPSSHVLKAKFHSYGGGVPESWSHEEYSGRGEFIARYESRAHLNGDGVRTSDGWKKFDFDDVLVASEDG